MEIIQEVWTLTPPKSDNVSSDPLPSGQSGLLSSPSGNEKSGGKIKILREKGKLTEFIAGRCSPKTWPEEAFYTERISFFLKNKFWTIKEERI